MDHGGDLTTARAQYGFMAKDWLDLSTGINPFAYPLPELPANCFQQLPGRDEIHTLLATLRESYAVPDGAATMVAPGSQAIIQALPTLFPTKQQVQIITPTYTEHEAAWRTGNHKVVKSDTPDPKTQTFIILTNPNNPDGRAWDPEQLLGIATTLSAKGGLLIIDEAFADAMPQLSSIPHSDIPGLLILRSFGKFFGLAGLRLGFAIGEQAVIKRLATSFGPWPISGPALVTATAALADKKWISAAHTKLKAESEALQNRLQNHGLKIAGHTPLFTLAETGNASALHDHLATRAIWTRKFSYNNSWLRIGLPPSEAALQRLDRALNDAPLDRYSTA